MNDNGKVKIHKHMAMPTKGRTHYPWDELEVGDAFEVKGKSGGRELIRAAMATRPTKAFEAHAIKGITYIWRTK